MPKMEQIPLKIVDRWIVIAVVFIVAVFLINRIGGVWFTFFTYLALATVTRLPKAGITDGFIVTDFTEFFVFYSAAKLGIGYGLLMLFMANWLHHLIVPMDRKVENPVDSVVRTIAMGICFVMFIAMNWFGFSLLASITTCTFFTTLIWALIAWFGVNVTQPAFFVMPFPKTLIYYNVMLFSGCCGTW